MNIVILAAARSEYGPNQDSSRLLHDVNGKTLLQHNIQFLRGAFPNCKITVVLLSEMANELSLANICYLSDDNIRVHNIGRETRGALCSVLLLVDSICDDDELLLLNSNVMLDFDLSAVVTGFTQSDADAGTIVFDSLHPRWSYVRTNDIGQVEETVEKVPISRSACVGIYWYRKSKEFFDLAKRHVLKRLDINGQFYIAPVFNEYVLCNMRVVAHEVASSSVSHII